MAENRRRTRHEREFELVDTRAFAQNAYFDVFVEYAKAAPEDLFVRIVVVNRGASEATIRVLPTIWFRNRWSWSARVRRPSLHGCGQSGGASVVSLHDPVYGPRWLYCGGAPSLLFTENDTNTERLFGWPATGYFKDGINAAVVDGNMKSINPSRIGTKAAADYACVVPAHGEVTLKLRLTDVAPVDIGADAFATCDQVMTDRQAEADDFYAGVIPERLDPDAQMVMRQAFAGCSGRSSSITT